MAKQRKRSKPSSSVPPAPEAAAAPAEPSKSGPSFPVIGIGSSAGGLSALRELLGAIPADANLACVLVHHLDPKLKSHMAEVLQAHTRLKVEAASHGTPIEPNVVYTIPSNVYMGIHHCVLSLQRINESQRAPHMPIDVFFRALADDCGEKAIGVLLSGSGSDGTIGLREIRGAGGLTIVQDPATAEYASMPDSAIVQGLADHVLPPAEIGRALAAVAHHQPVIPADIAGGGEAAQLNAILALVAVRTRVDFRPYKRTTILRRLRRQMSLNRVDSLSAYLKLLRDDHRDKVAQLAADMLIGVTSFFRDADAWAALRRHVIGPLVHGHAAEEALRVWVAGCSTGEEAYSIAIELLEEMNAAQHQFPVQIFASDIDEKALKTARMALYPENIAVDVPPTRLARNFAKVHDGYQVDKRAREWVTFAVQNFIADPPFSRIDLLSCRNVLIYLDAETQRRAISLFAYALNPGGYLFLGKSDTIAGQHELFDVVSAEHHIYRRTRSPRTTLVRVPALALDRPAGRGVRPAEEPARLRPSVLTTLNQNVLLRHLRAAVILVDRSGTIIHFFGDTGRFLHHPTGGASLNVIDMVPEVLSSRLAAALKDAVQGKTVTIERVPLHRGAADGMNVTVRRADERRDENAVLAIIFEELHSPAAAVQPPGDAAGAPADPSTYAELVAQVRHTKHELQTTIEELETSNEELKAVNEEVTSVNEELQSANEELETSKEELQSVNEELTTVNNQLQEKVDQLAHANSDLANLFTATDIATLFLDHQMRIRRYTPRATDLLRLIPSDAGRPIGDISHRFKGIDLAAAGEQVLRRLTPVEQPVNTDDERWFAMRVIPYRTANDRIDGVVITFHDITELKRREEALRVATEQLASEVRNHAQALQQTRAALEQEMARREELSQRVLRLQDEERQRIAAELHDSTAQNLAALAMLLARLQKPDGFTAPALRKAVAEGNDLVQSVMREVRMVSYLLHPPLLESVGLVTALRGYVEGFAKRSGVRVDLKVTGDLGRLPVNVKTCAFRVLQECLTNVHRHAGSSTARVSVARKGNLMTLQVEDSGRGFPRGVIDADGNAKGRVGVGIPSMTERLRQLGGTLQIRSMRKKTVVTASIPVDGQPADARPIS